MIKGEETKGSFRDIKQLKTWQLKLSTGKLGQ